MPERAPDLDSDLAAAVDDVADAGVPPWHAMSVDAARRVEDEVFAPAERPPVDLVRDVEIPGPESPVPLRAYRPDAADPATTVFYHGGGWTLGTLDSVDVVCRRFARRTGTVVLSVDYRLAPEHPFPAAVDDAHAALAWAADHADAFGADPDRLAVAGTSAGGNLAAATALRARETGGPEVAQQALLYPILDHALDTDSYDENAEAPLLTRADMAWFWEQYLRSPVDGHNPFASPLRAPDLAGLPPATVLTAGYDPLRDEAAAYADRLDDAGVDVERHHYPALAHGFLSLASDVPAADGAFDRLAERVRALF
jgi:acetyl esterase